LFSFITCIPLFEFSRHSSVSMETNPHHSSVSFSSSPCVLVSYLHLLTLFVRSRFTLAFICISCWMFIKLWIWTLILIVIWTVSGGDGQMKRFKAFLLSDNCVENGSLLEVSFR